VRARSGIARWTTLALVLVVMPACGRVGYTQTEGTLDASTFDGDALDAATSDATGPDGAVDDAALDDAGLVDATAGDAALDDAALVDAALVDAALDDATAGDAALDDAALVDAALVDAALVDAALDDAALDGGPPADVRYIAPTGSDAFPGTRAQPFRTFSYALAQLVPGSTLIALDGTYGASSATGYLDADCRPSSTSCDGAPCRSGEIARPIVVRAENERQAILRNAVGSGTTPIRVRGCTDWIVEGLTAVGIDDTGGIADSTVSISLDDRVTLRRVLAAQHNTRVPGTHVFGISESSGVLLEECEAYDFASVGYMILRSSDVVVRRSYANHRGSRTSAVGAIELTGSGRAVVENAVAEGSYTVGMYVRPGAGIAGSGDDIRLLGNVVQMSGATTGRCYDVRSECADTVPCIDEMLIVSRAQLIDNVAIGGSDGLYGRGSEDLVVRGFTSHGPRVQVDVILGNSGLVRATVAMENALITGAGTGFYVADQTEWYVDHANAFVSRFPFSPAADPRYTNTSTLDPALGGCLVYIPASSPMRGAGVGGADIGANVVMRYQDGVLGSERLWDAATGRFPCGATVAGINDAATFPSASCVTAHQRLNVGTGGCAIP
jgi:uncharacterized protein YjbI with pentapeptide repeats